MKFLKTLPISYFLLITFSITMAHAARFHITNNCPDTVWAAAMPGGGRKLDRGQTWTINVPPGTTGTRIWARTNCNFDASGRGKCETGDCNGLLECQGYGAPPNTLAEFALNQYNDLDFIDMSVVDGFNVPMEFSSVSPRCNLVIKCTANITSECPPELKVPGGCNGPCPVFKTEEHCCNSLNCTPTNLSRFFKDRCPDVFSYPMDNLSNTYSCPSGTDYKVVFCPCKGDYGVVDCGSLASMQAVFEIQNNCSYTVWAAANPGGGKELQEGQSWVVYVDIDPTSSDIGGRIWGRTNCNFNANGTGKCESGDCDGALNCASNGATPFTSAEYALNRLNDLDFFFISLLNGFNVPMEFKGTSSGCTKEIKCTGDINGFCPTELRHPGGCNNPCTVFKNEQFCCRSGNSCGTTAYSRFFEELCPSVYSYPRDNASGAFTCPTGSNYKVVFCP